MCELCGHIQGAAIAVAPEDVAAETAARELAHEFELGDLLGRGKHSAVIRVRERNSGRTVVLKLLPRRNDIPDAEESFRAMMGMFAGFDHPQIVPVLRFGSTDTLFWYTMEDLGATSVRSVLLERGVLDARTSRRIATQVVSALDHLHRHGIIHGAIKADNVLLDKDGWARICDPSFVRARWKRRSRSTPSKGITPERTSIESSRAPWVAPEDHTRGERLPAADQYALAALLFECLSGRPPSDPPEPLLQAAPQVPVSMARAIDTALSPDPFRRFPSCTDFLFALDEGSKTLARPRTPARSTNEVVMIKGWEAPPDVRRPLVLFGRVLATLSVAAVLVWSAPTLIRLVTPPGESAAPSSPAPPVTSRVTSAPAELPSPPTAAPSVPPATIPPLPPRATTRPAAPRVAAPRPSGTPAARPSPAVVAPAPARLFVNATPWGVVYLDGALLGNTPRVNLEVAAGEHTVRVVRSGFVPIERVVRLQPGETLRLTDLVLVPSRP